ncbi:MAG: hypothetical protein ACLQVI_32175 [Polyangiaceae bacterium]
MKLVTSIRQLRPSVGLDEELDWFFNRAECDMGNQSNFLAMLGRHGPGSAIPSPEDAVDAAHRARLIHRSLTAMDSADAGVLQCAYALRAWPVVLWDQLGRLTGVVVRLACALDRLPAERRELQLLEMARADWLAAQCGRAALDPALDSTCVRLRREAQTRFVRAHQAYGVARRGRPS